MIVAEKDSTQQAEPFRRQIVAESRVMRDILSFVHRVAVSEASSFLIEGENGTGKDLVATALHYQSLRRAGPFLAINCAAIPETLLESELFGHEKGAFTDARAQKRGLFELADRGTLFLDEIDGIAPLLQAKLLRVLENQSLRRVGGLHDVSVDIRIIAASNRDLHQAVKDGAFRQDLYYRLNVIQIVIPPAARADGRYTAVGAVFHRTLQPEVQAPYRRHNRWSPELAADTQLARQRARVTQCNRTRHDS